MSDHNEERAEGLLPPPVGSPAPERVADPGWYRLSKTDPQWCWWDGTRWTDHMMLGPHPEAISSKLNELGSQVGTMRKDIEFIANVMRVLVVLWVLGLGFWVLLSIP